MWQLPVSTASKVKLFIFLIPCIIVQILILPLELFILAGILAKPLYWYAMCSPFAIPIYVTYKIDEALNKKYEGTKLVVYSFLWAIYLSVVGLGSIVVMLIRMP